MWLKDFFEIDGVDLSLLFKSFYMFFYMKKVDFVVLQRPGLSKQFFQADSASTTQVSFFQFFNEISIIFSYFL